MATTVLHTTDVFEFDVLPYPGWSKSSPVPQPVATDFVSLYHPKAGQIQFKQLGLSHIHAMEMRWDTTEDIELLDKTVSKTSTTIDINFVLEGSLDTQFQGIGHQLPMRSRTHNLIHTPETGHINRMKGRQSMSMMLISLDKKYFSQLIGQEDAWSEQVLTDLHFDRPFSGGKGAQTITPQMLYLLDDIRNCKATGPMRNLLIQSRLLELLALEVEQFKGPDSTLSTLIPIEEVEKLHHLKAYLEVNFLQEQSLAQLSRYCLLNEFKVKKGFRQLFNTTVFNYIRSLRMDYAGQLLRNSSLSVDEIADKLSYEYAQHFSIAFKKYTGLTPSEFKQGKYRSLSRMN